MRHHYSLVDTNALLAKLEAAEAGAEVDFSADEAQALGAFVETALCRDDVGPPLDEWSLVLPGMEAGRE